MASNENRKSKKTGEVSPTPANEVSGEATRHVSKATTLELWVRSGGRCALCNKFLLEHPFFEWPIVLGEKAHNVGWTDTKGSPRGDSELPLWERNKAKNLLLLCKECHDTIDLEENRAYFTTERLTELKTDHEDRIHHLTAMAKDQETAVLRVFGSIRGTLPEMAREEATRCVLADDKRYARFPLAPDSRSVEVNLAALGDPETAPDAYWTLGKAHIERLCGRVSDSVNLNEIRHVSVFAMARIPLLVYLGYRLDDKVQIELYQSHRDRGWGWPNDEATPQFEVVTHQVQDSHVLPTEAVLILSLSGTIGLDELPDEMAGLTTYEIRPSGVTPNPNLFRTKASPLAFARTYQDLLAQIEQTSKSVKTIHLFAAAPTTAAIACGRHIMRDVQPALKIYDRIHGTFQPAFTINKP